MNLMPGMGGAISRLNVIISATDRATGIISNVIGKMNMLKIAAVGAVIGGTAWAIKSMASDYLKLEKTWVDAVVMFDNLTEEQERGLMKVARRLGEQYAGWVTVGNAMQSLFWIGSSGIKDYSTAVELAGMSAKFAAANSVDMAEATRLAMTLMKTWGFTVSDLNYRLDQITMAQKSALLTMDDLIETMKYASGASAALGVSFEELLALLDIFADANVAGSMAGTALRRVLGNMIAPTEDVKEKFKEMGVELFDKTTGKFVGLHEALKRIYEGLQKIPPEQREAYLSTITGIRAWSGMTTVMRKLNTEYVELIDNIENATGVQDELWDKKSDTYVHKIEEVKTKIQNFKETVGGIAASVLIGLGDAIVVIINGIVYAVSNFGAFLDEIFSGISKWMDNFDENWNKFWGGLGSSIKKAGETIIGAINTLIGKLQELWDAIINVNWTNIWMSLINGMASYIVNPLLDGINWMIKQLNKLPWVNISPIEHWNPFGNGGGGGAGGAGASGVFGFGRNIMPGNNYYININQMNVNDFDEFMNQINGASGR